MLDKRRVTQGFFSPQPMLNVNHGQRQIQAIPPGRQNLQKGNGIRAPGHGNHDPVSRRQETESPDVFQQRVFKSQQGGHHHHR